MSDNHTPPPVPAERTRTSATAEFLFRLSTEMRPIVEGRVGATTAVQLSPEVELLFVRAFDEVSQKLPELKSAVMELRAASFALLVAIQDGDGDRISGAGKRYTYTSDDLFSQLALLEDRTSDGRTVPPPSPPQQDGPQLPDKFWWKGQSYELQPTPCRLLAALWGHDRIREGDVIEQVWGHDADCKEGALTSCFLESLTLGCWGWAVLATHA